MKTVLTMMVCVGMSSLVQAEDVKPQVITIENHLFHPTEIHIPSNQRAEILVKNLDPEAEEFESGALSIEKVIAGKSEGLVRIRATPHGHYTFVGEYHEKTARGVLIAD
jgi:hypothetical protein